jgi:flavin-dependent dehydrogenase
LKRYNYLDDSEFIDCYTYGGIAHSSNLKYKVRVEREKPVGAMVLRDEFDNELLKHAILAGTKFIGGKSVIDIKTTKEKAKIILQDGKKIESIIAIGCDGIWSTIAKKTGLSHGMKNIGMCIYEEFPLSKKKMDNFFDIKRFCHIHLKPQGIAGYGWVFPKKNV